MKAHEILSLCKEHEGLKQKLSILKEYKTTKIVSENGLEAVLEKKDMDIMIEEYNIRKSNIETQLKNFCGEKEVEKRRRIEFNKEYLKVIKASIEENLKAKVLTVPDIKFLNNLMVKIYNDLNSNVEDKKLLCNNLSKDELSLINFCTKRSYQMLEDSFPTDYSERLSDIRDMFNELFVE